MSNLFKKLNSFKKVIEWNGEFVKTEFDSNKFYFGKFVDPEGHKYEGMLDKQSHLPTGFGRFIMKDNDSFSDG